jgi:hypothetical protein
VSFVELAKIDVDVLFRNKNVEVDIPIDPPITTPPAPEPTPPAIIERRDMVDELISERERSEDIESSHTHKLLSNQYTSIDDDHKHSYITDAAGNGRTSYDDGHMHTIRNKVVAPIYESQERREEVREEAPPGEEERREEDTTGNDGGY